MCTRLDNEEQYCYQFVHEIRNTGSALKLAMGICSHFFWWYYSTKSCKSEQDNTHFIMVDKQEENPVDRGYNTASRTSLPSHKRPCVQHSSEREILLLQLKNILLFADGQEEMCTIHKGSIALEWKKTIPPEETEITLYNVVVHRNTVKMLVVYRLTFLYTHWNLSFHSSSLSVSESSARNSGKWR